MFDQMKSRVSNDLMNKTNDLTQREKERKEREDLKKELFEVRVNRLKEVGFDLHNDSFMAKEGVTFYQKSFIENASSLEFEEVLSDIKKSREDQEQTKRNAEIKRQKDEQFEVRKNRLFEIGFVFGENVGMNHNEFVDIFINTETVYNASITEFEQILVDAKKSIADAKAQKEANEKAQQEAEKRAAAEQKKAEAENKARIKRLANDKKIISESFEVYFADLHLETENKETKDFIERANFKIAMVKSELLTELNEL
jgi:hypothetical protein